VSVDLKAAWEPVKAELLALAAEVQGDAREKLASFATIGESVLVDLVNGDLSEEQATEAKDNLVLAARSALINEGYKVQARTLAAISSGLTTAIKIAATLLV
jgi:hypothetical protein